MALLRLTLKSKDTGLFSAVCWLLRTSSWLLSENFDFIVTFIIYHHATFLIYHFRGGPWSVSLFHRYVISRQWIYTQSPFIRTTTIRLNAEILGKFKTRALGSSNLRTTSKNLRLTSAQIFKAKNQFVDGPQKRSKWVNYTALRNGNLDD